jgi:hypothetical protein
MWFDEPAVKGSHVSGWGQLWALALVVPPEPALLPLQLDDLRHALKWQRLSVFSQLPNEGSSLGCGAGRGGEFVMEGEAHLRGSLKT